MKVTSEYRQAVEQAKTNLTDLQERGMDAMGSSWEDVRTELFTPGEIASSTQRIAQIGELIEAKHEKGITPGQQSKQ